MRTMNPDTDSFRTIQIWLHIHSGVGYYIRRCFSSGEHTDDQTVARMVQDYLDHCFGNKNLEFGSNELIEVWKYECKHKESYDTCEEYLNKQKIRRRFP